MKDIEKMRKEFAEQIRLAEIENKYSEPLAKYGLEISIIGNSFTQKGKIQATARKAENGLTTPLDERDVQNILEVLPMTEKSRVYIGDHKYDMLSYELATERNPREARTMLKIGYIHNELDLSIDLPINESDPELMQYFTRTQRELDSSTIGLYYGAVSPAQRGRLKMLSFLTFNCGHVVRFSGGTHRQISEGHANCIISSLQCDDFSWKEESC